MFEAIKNTILHNIVSYRDAMTNLYKAREYTHNRDYLVPADNDYKSPHGVSIVLLFGTF